MGYSELKLVQKTIHSTEHEALRQLLKDARLSRDLSQVELSARLEEPQSFVSKVERGDRMLNAIEFADYVSALGLKPAKLFGELLAEMNRARKKKAS